MYGVPPIVPLLHPGLVRHEGALWISYYSGHEGNTTIYLAWVNASD